jgi:hypothetical protein
LDDYKCCGRHLADVFAESEIAFYPSKVNHFGNKCIIDFDASSSSNEELDIIYFNTLINKELWLCHLPNYGKLSE